MALKDSIKKLLGIGKDEGQKYPHNVLEAFGTGAILDLRVRLAVNWIQHSPAVAEVAKAVVLGTPAHQSNDIPAWIAHFALELADQLLEQGAERGWVEGLPDPKDTKLDDQLRAQAMRTARYNVLQQILGNKAAQEEQGGIIPVAPVIQSGQKH